MLLQECSMLKGWLQSKNTIKCVNINIENLLWKEIKMLSIVLSVFNAAPHLKNHMFQPDVHWKWRKTRGSQKGESSISSNQVWETTFTKGRVQKFKSVKVRSLVIPRRPTSFFLFLLTRRFSTTVSGDKGYQPVQCMGVHMTITSGSSADGFVSQIYQITQ